MLLFERILRPCRALRSNSATRARKFKRNTRGGVAAIVAIVSPVLVGAMGLGGEAGYWYLTQRKVQNAADVAAHAAAVRHNAGDTFITVEQLAEYVVSEADVDLTISTVDVNQPPSQGAFIEDGAAIEVVVTQTVPRLFSAIYSTDAVEISARAVATAVGDGQGCVLALSETAEPAVEIFGTAALTLLNCELISNGPGVSVDASIGISTLIAGCVRTSGTVELNLLTVLTCSGPIENASPVGDPLSGLPEPAITGTCQDGSVGSNALPTFVTATESHASGMSAMRFCNGLSVRGVTTFSPGLYIIEGGNFELRANSVVAGTGVVFYLAEGVAVDWAGNSTGVFTAPTSGTYNGVVIFGDRDSTAVTHGFNGTAATSINGTIYTPSAHIELLGSANTSLTNCTQIITNTIEIGGTGALTLHCLFPTGETIVAAGESSVVE